MISRAKLFLGFVLFSAVFSFGALSFLFLPGVTYQPGMLTVLNSASVASVIFGSNQVGSIVDTSLLLVFAFVFHVFLAIISVVLVFKKHFLLLLAHSVLSLFVIISYFVGPLSGYFADDFFSNVSLAIGFPLMAISVFISFIAFVVAYFIRPSFGNPLNTEPVEKENDHVASGNS